MNATNRGVNRIVLFVVGVVLIAVGGAAAVAAGWPVAGDVWEDGMSSAVGWMRGADRASRLSEATSMSWFTLGVLFVLLLIVIIAVTVVARLGGGRSSMVIHEEAEEGVRGSVTICRGFASDAITHSLSFRDEILSSRVTGRRIRGTDVLHVSVTPRRTASPVGVAETVTRLVDNLVTLTGRDTPTLVSIRSGVRSRLAADQSRVN